MARYVSLIISVMIVVSVMGKEVNENCFYVSTDGNDSWSGSIDKPFATIAGARNALRKLEREDKGDITVYIRDGVYQITEPIVFGPQDGGGKDSKVVYKGYNDERPLISAGEKLKGWTYDKTSGCWQIKIDVNSVTDLYCENQRLTRARWPEEGKYAVVMDIDDKYQKIELDRDLPQPINDDSTRLIAMHIWAASHTPIKSASGRSVETLVPAGTGFHALDVQVGRKVYFENVLWSVNTPGEFAFDAKNKMLFAKFKKGFNPNKTAVILPKSQQFIIVKGSIGKPVENLHFKNINFYYSLWNKPANVYEKQAGYYKWQEKVFAIQPAIEFAHAENCGVERCQVAFCGATGLGLGVGTVRCKITGCQINNVGGNGVMVGYRTPELLETNLWYQDWHDTNNMPISNEISHNWVKKAGENVFGSVGIWQAFAPETKISNNLVEDLPYSGISIGFSWQDDPTCNKDNYIAYNEIRDVMKLFWDGGGIYTLGNQPGTIVANNYLHNIKNGQGIYTDQGSSEMLFKNNIIYKIKDSALLSHKSHSNIFRNNIFACARVNYIRKVPDSKKQAFWMDRNIFWIDGGRFITGMLSDGKFQFTNNIYWHPYSVYPLKFTDYVYSHFPAWQAKGLDVNGMFVDPQFVNPEKGDFTLPNDSPAVKAGFEPIDMDEIGPKVKWDKISTGY